MNRLAFLPVLAAAAVAALAPVAASAQSRSMIPPETLEVFLGRQDTMFNRMDANQDGFVTTEEVEAAASAMRARMGGGAGGPPPAPPAGAPAGAPAGGPGGGGRGGMMGRMIAEADTDGDGKVSRAEMRAGSTKRFQEMDKNADGVLSADERPQGFGMRGQWGGQGGAPGGGAPVQIPMGDEGN